MVEYFTILAAATLLSLFLFAQGERMQRVAVVTGSNQGIGKEIAKKLLKSGCKTILACRNLVSAEATAKEFHSEGLTSVECRELDIGNESSIQNFVSNIEKDYECIDVLVNNAAIAFKGSDPTPFQVSPSRSFSAFILCLSCYQLLFCH